MLKTVVWIQKCKALVWQSVKLRRFKIKPTDTAVNSYSSFLKKKQNNKKHPYRGIKKH